MVAAMKLIIAGSRSLSGQPHLIGKAIEESKFTDITEIVSGTATGIDRLGEEWATNNGKIITRFPANWTKYGKSAGPIRNAEMAIYADALIAIWDHRSRGTNDMIRQMDLLGKPLHILIAEPRP